jgi:hypothetical protein
MVPASGMVVGQGRFLLEIACYLYADAERLALPLSMLVTDSTSYYDGSFWYRAYQKGTSIYSTAEANASRGALAEVAFYST